MKPRNEAPTQAEFGDLVAFLAANGATQQQIREAIGSGPNGRTRKEIAGELKAWLKNRPKG